MCASSRTLVAVLGTKVPSVPLRRRNAYIPSRGTRTGTESPSATGDATALASSTGGHGVLKDTPYDAESRPGPNLSSVLTKRLAVRGFIVSDHNDRWNDFYRDMSAWVRDGRLTYRKDGVDGLERAPEAFIGLLQGGNFGKLLVRVSEKRRSRSYARPVVAVSRYSRPARTRWPAPASSLGLRPTPFRK